MIGNNYTVEQQRARLPLYLQDYYITRQLDRIQIDGEVFQGYSDISTLGEISFFKSPIRSSTGKIENLNSYSRFITPRVIITYKMFNIDDYRRFMQLIKSKAEFTVFYYDIEEDTRIYANMYVAPTSMPKAYQRLLQIQGVMDYTIELIGTNTGVEEYTLTYNYNIPNNVTWSYQRSATQTFAKNISDIVGSTNAPYKVGNTNIAISSQTFGNSYQFVGWYANSNGTGFGYRDSDAYFINNDKTLYAKWVASV